MRLRKRLVSLGRVVVTRGALAAFVNSAEIPLVYLARHQICDWGEIDPDDAKVNDEALKNGERILSAYTLHDGTRIWIMTEANRESTCILLPEEY